MKSRELLKLNQSKWPETNKTNPLQDSIYSTEWVNFIRAPNISTDVVNACKNTFGENIFFKLLHYRHSAIETVHSSWKKGSYIRVSYLSDQLSYDSACKVGRCVKTNDRLGHSNVGPPK